MSRRRAVAHLSDGTVGEVDPHSIDPLRRDPRTLVWLDLLDPSADDLALLREEFGFHELALEDALRRGQRPKVDEYEDHYFIVLYAAECTADRRIATHELHCFWGRNYLVTLHDGPVAEVDLAIGRWESSTERRQHGVAYQVYALLDAVIDGYFLVLDTIADRIDGLESQIFETRSTTIRELFSLRKDLLDARRLLAPSRDVLNVLIRRDIPVFPPRLTPYLIDVQDHTLRIIDQLDLNHEILANAVESHLSAVSNRLNQTMRTLTAATVAIMIPTLIAGIYGMNYALAPGNDWAWGFWSAVGVMAMLGLGALVVFWRIGWL